MDTQYIDENKETRFLTKFEKDCLLAEWVEEYAEQYPVSEQKEKFDAWVEEMNWSEIDEIISHLTK